MADHKILCLRPKADKDLEVIYKYSYQKFGSARADQYINDLDIAFHKLASKPCLGSDYSHVIQGLMAYVVVSHVIFFRPTKNGITIIRVLHKSMDYGRHV